MLALLPDVLEFVTTCAFIFDVLAVGALFTISSSDSDTSELDSSSFSSGFCTASTFALFSSSSSVDSSSELADLICRSRLTFMNV